MHNRQGSSPVQRHPVELYTDQLVVQGSLALPFRRVTEIVNSPERDYLSVDGATVTPLLLPHQAGGPNAAPVLVRRTQVRFIATYTDPSQSRATGGEFAAVHKVPMPCYGFLGPFVFHAHLHIRPGNPLLEVLELGSEPFLPLTQATVYQIAHPEIPPRQHEVIIINRTFLDVIYLV